VVDTSSLAANSDWVVLNQREYAIAHPEWIAGLFVSLVLGAAVVEIGLRLLRYMTRVGDKRSLQRPNVTGVPGWLTGVVERLFFTILIGFGVQGVPAAMMAWTGLKLATNWNHPRWKDTPEEWTVFAFTAVLASLISMLFASLGGLICAHRWNVGIVL
jgi:hypothetical protein